MNPSPGNSRSLQIDDMKGEACVQKVTGTLQGVPGVKTESVSVGVATIVCDPLGSTAACTALGKAGYPSRETPSTQDVIGTKRESEQGAATRSVGSQSVTPTTPTPVLATVKPGATSAVESTIDR